MRGRAILHRLLDAPQRAHYVCRNRSNHLFVMNSKEQSNRRDFIRTSAAAAGALALPSVTFGKPDSRKLKLGWIGCGGRGSGAINQALNADSNIQLWSIGEAFQDKADAGLERIKKIHPGKVDVDKGRVFVGLDAYKKVIDSGVDVVILTTPPGFRPMHIKAAVDAADGSVVWPDANQGYTLDQALRMARAFEAMGMEVFEQPIPMTDIYGMKKLLSSTTMNIAIDEAAMGIPYLIEMIRREAVEGVVIKVNKVGGIYYARQMCDLIRNAGFKLIGSGLMDAPIGFQASVQLFAGYGIDFPTDLNGPQHIAEDYLAELLPKDGQNALVTQTPGIGVVIDEDRVRGELKLNLKI